MQISELLNPICIKPVFRLEGILEQFPDISASVKKRLTVKLQNVAVTMKQTPQLRQPYKKMLKQASTLVGINHVLRLFDTARRQYIKNEFLVKDCFRFLKDSQDAVDDFKEQLSGATATLTIEAKTAWLVRTKREFIRQSVKDFEHQQWLNTIDCLLKKGKEDLMKKEASSSMQKAMNTPEEDLPKYSFVL